MAGGVGPVPLTRNRSGPPTIFGGPSGEPKPLGSCAALWRGSGERGGGNRRGLAVAHETPGIIVPSRGCRSEQRAPAAAPCGRSSCGQGSKALDPPIRAPPDSPVARLSKP
jgi:hypothetical protein